MSKSKGKKYHTEEFELFDGEVLVYRTKHSGKVWQFRTWITENQKYFRQSLRVKDRELARDKARELFFELHAKIRIGHQLFDTTVKNMCETYLSEQEKRIRKGETGKGGIGITEGRFKTIKTQVIRHLIPFLGEKTKLQTIKGDQFKYSYTQYRKKKNPKVQNVTIINERATIGSVFNFAFDKGWIKQYQLPKWEEMHKDARSRDAFTLEEWKEFYSYIRSWTKNETNKKLIEQKNFIRNFILILANTGLRFGELRSLQWKNVKVRKDGKNKYASIDVDISKTGRRLGVIGRRGDIFERVKTLSNYTKPGDLIFVDNDTGEAIRKKTYYKLWNEIIDNTSLKTKFPKPSYYCLRHTYATFRLYANVPVFDLAKNLGCSVKFIEDHYGHVDISKRVKILTKDFRKEEIAILIEE